MLERVTGEDGIEALARIRAASVDVDGHDPLDEADRLRVRHHGLEDSELWLAGEPPAGFALRHGRAVDLAVAPDARRAGLGGALAAATMSGTDELTAWSHGDHPGAAALADRHRLRRVRELWVMRRPASEPLPPLVVPAGLTVRGYRDTDRDEVLRVNAAAFAHHPEQGAMDLDDLAARMGEDWFDPAGLLVADDGAGLRGFHWTKREPGATSGEVYVVAVDPGAQGQGLGTVLTLAGLHHLEQPGPAQLGVTEVLLYVESDNAAAIAVYAGLGFTHAGPDTHVQYRRPPNA